VTFYEINAANMHIRLDMKWSRNRAIYSHNVVL